jgi:hypothetical protein
MTSTVLANDKREVRLILSMLTAAERAGHNIRTAPKEVIDSWLAGRPRDALRSGFSPATGTETTSCRPHRLLGCSAARLLGCARSASTRAPAIAPRRVCSSRRSRQPLLHGFSA